MFKSPSPVIVLSCAAVTALASPALRAAVIERQEVRLSADVCQPSRPGADSTFRRRPLAMENEGTSTVFLTCAFGGVFNGVPSQKTLTVGFLNSTATAATASCRERPALMPAFCSRTFCRRTAPARCLSCRFPRRKYAASRPRRLRAVWRS